MNTDTTSSSPTSRPVTLAHKGSKPRAKSLCAALTKAGHPCTSSRIPKSKYCFMHTGDNASRVGRRGGHRRTIFRGEELPVVKPPESAGDVLKILSLALVEVRAQKIEPRVANAISCLAGVYLNAIQVADFADRLDALEARSAFLKGG